MRLRNQGARIALTQQKGMQTTDQGPVDRDLRRNAMHKSQESKSTTASGQNQLCLSFMRCDRQVGESDITQHTFDLLRYNLFGQRDNIAPDIFRTFCNFIGWCQIYLVFTFPYIKMLPLTICTVICTRHISTPTLYDDRSYP